MHPIEQTLKTELAMNRADSEKRLAALQKSLDHRIATCVKSEVAKSEKFYQSNFKTVLEEKLQEGTELDNRQLTRQVLNMTNEIHDIKNQSHNFILSQQLERLHVELQNINTRISVTEKMINQMMASDFIETDITPQEMKELYNKSQASPEEMSKFLKLDRTRFYQILNGKEAIPNLKRRHEMKQYFLKKIYKAQVANAD